MKPRTKFDAVWGTWNPDRPVELSQLKHGYALTPVIYSARGNELSTIASNKGFTFGERGINDGRIRFKTEHHETRLDWNYALPGVNEGNDSASIEWRTQAHGEWGLRFWVCICVSGPPDCQFEYDPDSGVLLGQSKGAQHRLIVHSVKKPLLTTFHQDLAALRDEMHEHGYFYLASRGTHGHFAVLRFNLEEAPAMRMQAQIVDDESILVAATWPDSPGPSSLTSTPTTTSSESTDPYQRSLMAIHDVVSWNHVFDRVNNRPYTVLTRNWNTHKFGGFGVWMNDIIYNALMWSLFDADRARHNIEAVFAWQTPQGNFPCLITGNDAWLDRSQPPIVAFVIWTLYQREQDVEFLRWAFDYLIKNHDWWWQCRELNDSGLVAYGTSLDVGDGLYKGTKLAAKDESSMDNMPVHDPAPFNSETGMLESFDVGLNSLLALDGEILALMADRLGYDDEAARLVTSSQCHKQRIDEQLWDAERGVFANRLQSGEFVESLAPTSFYPLAAGIGSDSQCRSLIDHYLNAPDKFGGTFGLPSCTRDDPAYADNVYWRGRIWAPLNYWVYLGLDRCGETRSAAELAERSAALFEQSWEHRLCGENYNAESGEVLDQADTDPFYSWGALLPLIKLSRLINITPWAGLALTPDQLVESVGPIRSPIGLLIMHRRQDCWEIVRDGALWLRGNLRGSLEHITIDGQSLTFSLTTVLDDEWFERPRVPIQSVLLNDQSVSVNDGRVSLRQCDGDCKVVVR